MQLDATLECLSHENPSLLSHAGTARVLKVVINESHSARAVTEMAAPQEASPTHDKA